MSETEYRLPNLIVPGQQKAGTTWLFHQLASHPEVQGSQPKEPQFFNQPAGTLPTKLAEYKRLFPETPGIRFYLEASTGYFWSKSSRGVAPENDTPAQLCRFLGAEARYLIVLRHPVARALSAFYHHFWKHRFDDDESLAGVGDRHGVLSMGKIRHQTQRWFEHIPPEQTKFLCFDDIKSNPQGLLDDVADFLEVSNLSVTRPEKGAHRRKNSGFKLKVHGDVIEIDLSTDAKANAELKRRYKWGWWDDVRYRWGKMRTLGPRVRISYLNQLMDEYAEDIAHAELLLGRDLAHWKNCGPEELLRL